MDGGNASSTVSAHQTGDVRADDLDAHLLLEGAEDGFVVEGAALHDDLPAQLLGAGGADDLIQGILDDADGQARRDVLDGCAILLGLLDRAVHEHGAAACLLYTSWARMPSTICFCVVSMHCSYRKLLS